jgi:pimeloyl-ACP methyl ester carboxylesterase
LGTKQLTGGIACHVEGSGPPLVLFHGGMGSWTHWIRNIAALARHFTVYAPDLPGCGDSVSVPDDIGHASYVDMVCAALEEVVAREPACLAGFSFGGSIASLVSLRMPRAIRKLALLNPGALGHIGPRRVMDLRKMPPEPASEDEKRAVLRHNLLQFMLAHPGSIDEQAIEIQRSNAARTRYDSRRFSFGTFTRDSIALIEAPIMAVFGELDNFAWPSIHSRVIPCRSLRPDMRIEIVPGAGHWVQYEAAPAVNRLLLDFFQSK